MNNVTLLGRVCNDLEIVDVKKSAYTRFSLAVADGKDKDGEPMTQFVPCIAWNSLAETLCEYVKKGDRLAIEGKLNIQRYTEEGEEKPRTTVQVICTRVHFIETKADREEKKEPVEEKKTYTKRKR